MENLKEECKNLPNGKTEIGIIPEDWEVVKLGDIGVFSKGKGISKKDIVNKGVPCVRYGEIYTKYDFKINKFCSFIPEDTASNSKKIKKNDILFAGSGETSEDIGKSVAYLGDTEAFAGGDIIIFTPQKTVNSLTLSYILNTGKVRKNISMLGQGNSVVHMYASHLKNLKIPLPPLPEQKKISKILSTWDNAIEKLEELINKKIEYKKGLMQKLLSGELRFPEFKEDWEVKKLKNIILKFPKSNYKAGDGKTEGKYTFYTNGSNNDLYINDYCYNAEAIIANTGGIPYFHYYNGKFSTSADCMVFTTKTDIVKFVYYQLFNNINKINKLGFTGSGLKHLDKKWFDNFKIPLPPLQEQQKIAEILTLQDKEIQLNKNKLKLLKEQKKGLMQNLLTGKIRVKT